MPIETLRERFAVHHLVLDGLEWQWLDNGGPGPAIFLLPGGQGTGEMFYTLFDRLGERARLVAIHYPGIPDLARIGEGLNALVDHLKLDRTSILGSSLGGHLAQLFTAAHPDRVDRLMLANSFRDCQREKALFPHRDALAAISARELADGAREKALGLSGSEGQLRLRRALLDQIGERQSAENYKGRLLAILDSTQAPVAPLSSDRITILDCVDDPVICSETRVELRLTYPGSCHLTFPEGGHFPALTAPDRFAQVVAESFDIR